jgi:hypothetical protein
MLLEFRVSMRGKVFWHVTLCRWSDFDVLKQNSAFVFRGEAV